MPAPNKLIESKATRPEKKESAPLLQPESKLAFCVLQGDASLVSLTPLSEGSLWLRLEALEDPQEPVLAVLQPPELEVLIASPPETLKKLAVVDGPTLQTTPGVSRLRALFEFVAPEEVAAAVEAWRIQHMRAAQTVNARLAQAIGLLPEANAEPPREGAD